MPDYVTNDNKENSSNDRENLEKLKAMIEKSNADLEQIDAQIEDIDRQIKEKEAEFEAKISQADFEPPKIFTRSELKRLLEEKETAKEKKLLELKNNIDAITKAELEKAKLIRAEAMENSELKKRNAELEALEIEVKALEKEQEVKGAILNEKKDKSQDVLASRISEDLKIEKLRRELGKLQKEKRDSGILGKDMRTRINASILNKNLFMHEYEKLVGEINDIDSRLDKSKKLLKSKLAEMENLKN